MLLTHSSTAKQDEKQEERGTPNISGKALKIESIKRKDYFVSLILTAISNVK
jgi:hypothetical protein